MIKYSRFVEDPDYDSVQYGMELEGDQYLTFDYRIIQQAYDEMKCKEKVCSRLALQTMIYRTGGKLRLLNQVSIHMYLTAFEGCPEHYFEVRGRKGISLDAKKVLSKLVANNYAPEFLEYYMAYKSYASRASKLASVLNCREVVCQDNFGNDLCKLPYNVNVQQNLRFNYKDCDVISQIPKDFTYAYAAPKGYCLAWGDFAQSDWRIAYNLFIRNKENDSIMNKYDDKYEALARLIARNGGYTFNLDDFKRMRPIYKVNTLATVYGTRGSVIPEDNQFIRMFSKFLLSCPKYAGYIDRIKDKARLGLGITVKSYFGYEQLIPSGYEAAITDKCLNTPVQTCTSEIMILTVNKIIRMFRERGYDRDVVRIFMSRHDEPVFLIRTDALKDAWIFKEFESIYVDDWTPLKLDFNYGYSYKRKDEGLEAIVAKSITDNADKIHFVTADTNIDNDFWPITDTLKLFVDWIAVGSDSIVTIYNVNEHKAYNMVVHSTDNEQVMNSLKMTVRGIADRIGTSVYEGIIVRGCVQDGQDSYADQFIKYENDETPNIQNVTALSAYTVCKYCAAKGIESPVAEPVADFDEMIASTKSWGIFNE